MMFSGASSSTATSGIESGINASGDGGYMDAREQYCPAVRPILASVVDTDMSGRSRQVTLGKDGKNDDGKRQELLSAVDFIYSHTQVERSKVRARNTRTKSEIFTCIEDDRLYCFAREVSDHGLLLDSAFIGLSAIVSTN
jgi:hypothetical protein